MARKRKSVLEQLAPQTEPKPQLEAPPIEHPVTHAERHQPAHEQAQSHVEAVGKREPRYNHQGKSDEVVGARSLERHKPFFQ